MLDFDYLCNDLQQQFAVRECISVQCLHTVIFYLSDFIYIFFLRDRAVSHEMLK